MMKKVISVILSALLVFSAFAVGAYAIDSEYQTYYINYDIGDERNIKIVPLEGYDRYVLPGEDFKFTIEVSERYSDTFLIVQLDMANIEPDIHGVYTISDIHSDHMVKVYFNLEDEQSNMFASIIVLVRSLFQMFIDMFNSLFSFAA